MQIESHLGGVQLRRSKRADVESLVHLVGLQDISHSGIPSLKCFGGFGKDLFSNLIETSPLCLTAVSTYGDVTRVLGFVALGSSPGVKEFPPAPWEYTLYGDSYGFAAEHYTKEHVNPLVPTNTLWINYLLAPPLSTHLTGVSKEEEAALRANSYDAESMAVELLRAALCTSPHIEHLLCAINDAYPLIEGISQLVQPVQPLSGPFQGRLYYAHRGALLLPLSLRLGRVEDYDDFVPLLVRGRGVITGIPENFFLEETLKDQDTTHKVIVAENTQNHHLAGLVCVRALKMDEQQVLTKRYQTDFFKRFAVFKDYGEGSGGGKAQSANVVLIDFLYFNPDYDGSVNDLIAFIYKQFPEYEYCAVCLPHDTDEPPFLADFQYLPIRKYQPHNARGESLAIPEGLWVHSRYNLEALTVARNVSKAQYRAAEMLLDSGAYGLSDQLAVRLREDAKASTSGHSEREVATPSPAVGMSFSLTWGASEQVVGVASARCMTVEDMYALRSNYDLDEYIYFYARKGRDYQASTISLTEKDDNEKFYSTEMPGVVVRAMYILPPFQGRFRAFVSEVLRLSGAEVAVTLASANKDLFLPISRFFLPAKPRRIQEKPPKEVQGDENATGAAKEEKRSFDVGGRDALLFTTQRCLGDHHKRINTRIVVVGAGTTGLAFLHRLLSIPYTSFTNIVLVSMDGLPPHQNTAIAPWSVDKLELLEREHGSLLLSQSIRVISGALVDLDKVHKFISIDTGVFEPYDYLILTTGRQYVVPPSVRTLQQQENQPARVGVIALSGDSAVDHLQQKLKEMNKDASSVANILVYGSDLEAFEVVTRIAAQGFSSQRIVLCSPSEAIPPSMNTESYQAASNLLKYVGTSVLLGYDVSRLEYDNDGKLSTVVLQPVSNERAAESSIELNCGLIVAVDTKDIDPNILSTLNKRSIVFDGRVIVENNYRTTDPFVFAAGPVAMFTRRYGATESFDDFNARDVGYHVAEVLMGYLGYDEFYDPRYHTSNEANGAQEGAKDMSLYTKVLEENGSKMATRHTNTHMSEMTETEALETLQRLPQYVSPLARRVYFPKRFTYFSARCIHFDATQCIPLKCSSIRESDDYRSFHQHLTDMDDQEGTAAAATTATVPPDELFTMTIYVNEKTRTIDCVSYFGNGTPEVHNYLTLIGYPETILRLAYRYKEAQQRAEAAQQLQLPAASPLTASVINGQLNLPEYLRLPHLQTVFFDRFASFFTRLKAKVRHHEAAEKLREQIFAKHKLESALSDEDFDTYRKELTTKQNAFKYQIQLELIKFLHEQKDFLPQNMFLPNAQGQVSSSIL